jgi:hypothetical protein
VQKSEPLRKADRVHETDEEDRANATDDKLADPKAELKEALLTNFGSVEAAHSAVSTNNTIGKKEWRRIIRKMMPGLSQKGAKALRRQLPSNASLARFSEFMTNAKTKGQHGSEEDIAASGLADLPVEVPSLPAAFRPRPDAHERLIHALLDSNGSYSTALTAPKSHVSSQGMGGVGKTMLTAAVVQDERVRRGFERIACE